MANLDLDVKRPTEIKPKTSEQLSRTGTTGETVPWPQLNWLERLVVRRSHPRALFINAVGAIWMTYFLAIHDLGMAIAVLVGLRVVAYASVWGTDPERLAQTPMGKMALLHLHPMNAIVQIIGLIPLLLGVWQHSIELILGGLSVILFGHLMGWSKIDPRYGVKESFRGKKLG